MIISGKPVLTADIPDFYQPLSRMLFKVMEDIGASTEMRDLSKDRYTSIEILMTLLSPGQGELSSYYLCGGRYEGTITPTMLSDLDCLDVLELIPVVVDTSSARQYECCLLVVQDSETPPGYAKLQFVYNGMPLSIDPLLSSYSPRDVDREGRVILDISSVLSNKELNIERHGPARTFTIPGIFSLQTMYMQ